MINLTISVMALTSMWIVINSNNPMKTSFFLLTLASSMFLMMKMKTGTVWLPLIFFLLFTGGILMLFMILASILPNEKTMKVKFSKWGTLLVLALLFGELKLLHTDSMIPFIKSFLTSSFNLIFMTIMILIYFFNSMSFNSVESYPMRSVQ